MRKGRQIKRRARIFLACEGESEQAYGALLQKLADAAGDSVHLVPRKIHPGGNPLLFAERAVSSFKAEHAKVPCVAQFLLMDTDMMVQMPAQARQAEAVLARAGFVAIWQRPDHEGFLLRHFRDHDRDDPPAGRAFEALVAVWPNYRKNMSAAGLQQVISLEDVLRAGGVVPDLMTLVRCLGLAPA